MRRPDPAPRPTGTHRAVAALAVAATALGLLSACTPSRPTGDSCGAGASPTPAPAVTYRPTANGDDLDAASAGARGRLVALPAGRVAFRDFRADGGTFDGGLLPATAGGLAGAGRSRTTVEIAPSTSTRAADIPTAFPDTNQLSVLKVAGTGTVLRDFTVRGTQQGHLYNGLRVDHVRDLRASRIGVIGIPGGDSSPPGETFGINDFRTVGSRWSHIRVDGAHVGAAGFGVNSSTRILICDAVSRNNAYSMGFAFWQSSGIRCVDCRAIDNRSAGFNFERTSGSVTLVRPVATGNHYAMRIGSDVGSARFTIIDPALVDGRWTVVVPREFYNRPNLQDRSAITLIVGGRKRPDLLRITAH